jgi:hypothetical protein
MGTVGKTKRRCTALGPRRASVAYLRCAGASLRPNPDLVGGLTRSKPVQSALSLLFRLEMNRHFTPLLRKLAISALRLRISRYGRCVLTLLRFSPTFLNPIGHHQTLMRRPPGADFGADAVWESTCLRFRRSADCAIGDAQFFSCLASAPFTTHSSRRSFVVVPTAPVAGTEKELRVWFNNG